jgi:hypothetical protein
MADAASTGHRPVIILGVDRSGTSIVAKLVHEWGAFGGDPAQLMEGDRGNPQGYWEHGPMALFVERIVTAVGPDFWRPDYAEALRRLAADPGFRGEAEGLVAGMAAGGPVWFWKEPWLCLLLPFWQEIWGDATYIITVRNPYDSGLSWQKMNVPPEVRGRISVLALSLLRWQHVMLTILRHTDGSKRRLFVPYEELIQDPASQCVRICGFLDAETGRDATGEGRAGVMAQAVDRSLWRNKSETDFSQVEIAAPEQKALYGLMRRKVEDPDAPFDAAAYPLYAGWREYLQNFGEFQIFYERSYPVLNSPLVRFVLAVRRRFAR